MSLIPYPNVPDVPGVPPIPRDAANSVQDPNPLSEDTVTLPTSQGASQWGIYDSDGDQIGVAPDGTSASVEDADPSTYDFDFTSPSQVSDFVVEDGSFASYNKVILPNRSIVTLIVDGTVTQRSSFLAALDIAKNSTDLYSVATPEVTYTDCNITDYKYRRAPDRGANIIIVAISLIAINSVSASFSSSPIGTPADPSATAQTNSGKVQTTTPSSSTQQSLTVKTIGGKSKTSPDSNSPVNP
jgi:hypothetical protein